MKCLKQHLTLVCVNLPEHKVRDGFAGCAKALDDDNEGGEDGAPEHLVI